MGIRGTYTTAFGLDNLRVPAENLLGKEGKGFNIAMDTLNGGRIGIAAQAPGHRRRGLRAGAELFEGAQAVRSAHQRVSGDSVQAGRHVRPDRGRQTADLQGGLAERKQDDLHHGLGAVQDGGLRGGHLRHQRGDPDPGGYGYICDYEVERMFRDAKITEIYEGTNEVQRLVISKGLLA